MWAKARSAAVPLLLAGALWGAVGLKYVAALGCLALAVLGLRLQHRALACPDTAPALRWGLALLAWLGLSLAWTTADRADALRQWAHYSLILIPPLLAAGLSADMAERIQRHFVSVGALVGLGTVLILQAGLVVPSAARQLLLSSTVWAEGNQRIATSLLLAGAAVWAAQRAAQGSRSTRLLWALGCAVAAWGLLTQDRRSGMAVLPFMLMAWAWRLPQPACLRWAAGGAIALLCALLWVASPNLRERFGEGWTELQQVDPQQAPTTSWGLRVALVETSLSLAAERPLQGWGVGAWEVEWRRRVPPDTLMAQMRTAHNEYLQVLVQGGLPALALLLGWGWALARLAKRRGLHPRDGGVVLALVAVAALFNVVLRDAVFALPLMVLLGVGLAPGRAPSPPQASANAVQ